MRITFSAANVSVPPVSTLRMETIRTQHPSIKGFSQRLQGCEGRERFQYHIVHDHALLALDLAH
eukprot:scaffold1951_cov258-Pinguiococcus_pyrenoidosus.AAC.29